MVLKCTPDIAPDTVYLVTYCVNGYQREKYYSDIRSAQNGFSLAKAYPGHHARLWKWVGVWEEM